jgi:hypothetical protein
MGWRYDPVAWPTKGVLVDATARPDFVEVLRVATLEVRVRQASRTRAGLDHAHLAAHPWLGGARVTRR